MPVDLLCILCGERGGDWQRGPLVGKKNGSLLERNQRLALAADDTGQYVWTHRCRGIKVSTLDQIVTESLDHANGAAFVADLPGVGPTLLRSGSSGPSLVEP
ncbi:MAG TPA: hypothetical protein VFA15_08640, partial [Nitrososphaera sp.]|nr:hypothetical protein [Nitrososphaera sp.]